MSCVTWYAQLLSSCLHFLALFCLFIICQEEVPNFPTVNLISDCSFKSCATHLRSLLIRTSVSVILSLDFVLSNLLLVSATHLFPTFGSIPFFPNPRTTLPFPSSLRRFLTLQALSCPPCLNSMKFLLPMVYPTPHPANQSITQPLSSLRYISYRTQCFRWARRHDGYDGDTIYV